MPPSESRIRAYLELLRLPNVFTALADVLMGAWFVTASPWRGELPKLDPIVLIFLFGSSACLYLGGMVLNDYFDRTKDAIERPARPIPSRRVAESSARWFGTELLIVGVGLAWAASYFVGSVRGGLVAFAITVAVILYDGWLKNTPLGPLAMGTCRMLNVLLGMSAASAAEVEWSGVHCLVAGGIGVYIVGVTLFARTEAVVSRRAMLATGTVVLLFGIGMLAWFPNFLKRSDTLVGSQMNTWYLFWAILAALIGYRCFRAIAEPAPVNVQAAVKQCIFSLIVLDASVTFAVQGRASALIIVALLVPTMFLGRWIYST